MNPSFNLNRGIWAGSISLTLLLVIGTCTPAFALDRTIDGTANNAANPTWGSVGIQLLRQSPVAYPGDGSGATILEPPARPNPREISNAIFPQVGSLPNSRGMTNGVWQWGQFIDHDLDLTGNSAANGTATILAPGDPYGVSMIPFDRSNFDPATGTAGNPRQQINEITSYLDASMVYGSDATRAAALRTMSGGRLKMGAGGLLPLNTDDPDLGAQFMADGGLGAPALFVAGDVRANEQVGLTAIHTLFVREHNRLAGELAAHNPGWNDERLYQSARRVVGAEIQAVTYNEFLPALLGPSAPRAEDYSYDPAVNASVATEFSTALYRVGHTLLSPDLLLAGDGGVHLGSIALREAFFDPSHILNDPSTVDHVLMGLAMSQAQEIDAKVVDDIRNFLFAPTAGPGIDLASLNIQRGRDHGLPDYNTVRAAYGLPAVASFAEITNDAALQSTLATLYGTVGNIDVWVGALAEDHVAGTSVGPLILAGLVDQFTRLRDGDAFFYRGDAELQSLEIKAVMDLDDLTFMDLMVWNTHLTSMPGSFFIIPEPSTLILSMLAAIAVARVAGRKDRRVAR